jgi:hypothetical protein
MFFTIANPNQSVSTTMADACYISLGFDVKCLSVDPVCHHQQSDYEVWRETNVDEGLVGHFKDYYL